MSWWLAFVAGAVSFLSPCVVPLVPGYLSYISGVTADDLQAGFPGLSGRILRQSLLFVAGFALVFVALGASASAAGAVLAQYRDIVNRIAGVFIFAMGLSLLGLLRVGVLIKEYRLPVRREPRGMAGAMLLGGAFAFAWILCVGPILASILAYAGTLGTVGTGALLLLVYALGLGLPFILTGLAFTRAIRVVRRLARWSRPIGATSGIALAAVGVLLLTNKMFYMSIWAQRLFTHLGLNLWQLY